MLVTRALIIFVFMNEGTH